ncbi:MAG: hypothetical protein ACFFDT_02425 [Candidatus Hodarchaeota archaeon]
MVPRPKIWMIGSRLRWVEELDRWLDEGLRLGVVGLVNDTAMGEGS